MLSPVVGVTRGFHAFPWGVRWLMRHKHYFLLLFLPLVIGIAVTIGGWQWLGPQRDALVTWAVGPEPQEFWRLTLYYVTWGAVNIMFLILTFVSFLLLTSVLASPVFEVVSMAVEKDITGEPVPETSLLQSLKLITVELKKALFILTVSTLLLFIPIINVISFVITAFLLGWNFYDYPLARRGWTFRQRFGFVLKHFGSVTGFGLWLMIPFVQIFLMPLAIVGGTKLNLDHLRNSNETARA